MPPKFKKFFQSWLINTLAVLVAVYVVPGIHYQHQQSIKGLNRQRHHFAVTRKGPVFRIQPEWSEFVGTLYFVGFHTFQKFFRRIS